MDTLLHLNWLLTIQKIATQNSELAVGGKKIRFDLGIADRLERKRSVQQQDNQRSALESGLTRASTDTLQQKNWPHTDRKSPHRTMNVLWKKYQL